ncbi:MAG: rhodanese-like domain-containing protein [Sulfuricellaceae bacterium]
MKMTQAIASTVLLASAFLAGSALAEEKLEVGITAAMSSMDVMHNGQKVTIMRNQDQNATVNPAFAKTSRKCPPFCIQPISLAPGVETIGEVEMIHYLKKVSDGDKTLMVIDSRTPDWVEKGMIPGAVNIPYTDLDTKQNQLKAEEILEKQFGVKILDIGKYDFKKAKTLVMYCNGMWCGQSPTNIKFLLSIGYPADKIKWYRGGMQDWEILGLTTVKP